MPGLFSWKPRLRIRKTPEREKVTVVNASSNNSSSSPINDVNNRDTNNKNSNDSPSSTSFFATREPKRVVRFNDNTTTGVGRNREVTKSPNDWKFIEETKIQSGLAPLARSEVVDESSNKEERTLSVPRSSGRASAVLQHLREDDAATHPDDADSSGTLRRTTPNRTSGSLGVVYLEFNDEVKRAILPSTIASIDTVRALFLRSFSQLTSQYLSLPHVKVYIQEPSKGQLFYELDDLSDIKDRAVLKLREQGSGFQSPQPPVRFGEPQQQQHSGPPSSLDYLSESDAEILDYRSRTPQSYRMSSLRPSSALDNRIYGIGPPPTKPSRSPVPPRFDPYYDPYASDTSSQDARSGSVTPIIDKEARFRMETMERQLAGLSSLVHSALVSKGMSETSQRDMHELRRQILALHPDINSASSLPSSAEPSIPDTVSLSGEAQQELLKLRRQAADSHTQLKQIRRAVQVNAQNSRDILRDAFDRIQHHIADHFGGMATLARDEDSAIEMMKSEHVARITGLQKSLQSFEEDIEEIRKLVLNTNRKLRMTEVESFTNSLTKIGRTAARLKTHFPSIQRELEVKIRDNMEKIVREERFIKEESAQIDQCLRRCKTLANMMVTMKKLAMVQDPTVGNNYRTLPPNEMVGTGTIPRKSSTLNQLSMPSTPQITTTAPSNSLTSISNHTNGPLKPTDALRAGGGTISADIRRAYSTSAAVTSPPQAAAAAHSAPHSSTHTNTLTTTTIDAVSTTVSVPPVPPSPLNYESPSTSDQKKEDANVLDAILDELTSEQNSPSQRKRETKSMSPSIHGPTPPYYPQASLHQQRNEPPKPPERQIKGDIRTRYTPSQLQQLQRHAATIYANSTANSTNTSDSASHTNSFGDRNPASGANTNTTTLPPQHNNSGFNSAGYYNQSHASATNGTAIGATGRATPTSHSAATLPNNSTNGSKPAERSMQKPPTPISSIDALGVSDPSTHGTSSNESINSQEGTRLMSADAIEERQHELAARQQQLYSQFEQLRQMCPSSPTNV